MASLAKHRRVKITSQPDKYPHRRLLKLTFNQAFHVGITPRSSSEIVTLSREKNLPACIRELSVGNYPRDCTLRVSGWPIYSGCFPLFFFFVFTRQSQAPITSAVRVFVLFTVNRPACYYKIAGFSRGLNSYC